DLRDRLRRVDAAAEIPCSLHLTIQEVIGALRPPIERSRGEIDGGARQRRNQGIAGRIVEMRGGGIGVRIQAQYRCIVTSGDPTVAAVVFAAKFRDTETPGKPPAYRPIDPRQRGHAVSEPDG